MPVLMATALQWSGAYPNEHFRLDRVFLGPDYLGP